MSDLPARPDDSAPAFSAIVPPGEAVATMLWRGSRLKVTDLEGQQVVDLIALNPDDPAERLSGAETLNFNLAAGLAEGSVLYSSSCRPMLKVLADTSRGIHDLTNAACSEPFYAHHLGVSGHANCRDSLSGALREAGVELVPLPTPVNLFQVTPVLADGSVDDQPGSAAPGEFITLEALFDCLVATSSCPCDIGAPDASITGARPSPVKVEVLPREPA